MDLNIGTMSSSMTKTTGMGGGFLGKSGDEWADIGLTVGGFALATAGVIGIGGLILDNFGGGSSSPSSEVVKKETVYLMYPDGRVLPANGPVSQIQQVAAPASPQPTAPAAPQPIPAHVALQQVASSPQPTPTPAPVTPQPTPEPQFVTKADFDKKIEEMTASVTEALRGAEKAATIRIDDSALEKIAELVAAKQAGSGDPKTTQALQPEKEKKSAK